MQSMLIGTSRGIYRTGNGDSERVSEGKGVREIVGVEQDILAGTADGVIRSSNQGQSWQNSGLTGRAVWQIKQTARGELIAGTQPAGVFISDNAGATWRELESFANAPEAADWCIPVDPPQAGQARAIVAHAQDAQILSVGVEVGGIMRSADGGVTWSLTLPGDNPDIHMMFAHPQNPETLFVSTGYGRLNGIAEMIEGNAGVFRSLDGGAHWEYVWHGMTPRYSRPMCIDARPPCALTVASAPTAFSHYRDKGGAQAMLFQSVDQGASWNSLCDPAHSPSPVNFHAVTPDPTHAGGVLVGTDNGEVWRVTLPSKWSQVVTGLPAVLSIYAA
jgi:hypothetical protein